MRKREEKSRRHVHHTTGTQTHWVCQKMWERGRIFTGLLSHTQNGIASWVSFLPFSPFLTRTFGWLHWMDIFANMERGFLTSVVRLFYFLALLTFLQLGIFTLFGYWSFGRGFFLGTASPSAFAREARVAPNRRFPVSRRNSVVA